MNVYECEQRSPEWFAIRRGCVTSSRIKDVMATRKDKKEAKPRENYRMELLADLLTGETTEHYVTAEMQYGIDNEGRARTAYEMANDVIVEKVGFVFHPIIPRCGVSPDGLVGEYGGVEIKVPKTVTHLAYRHDKIVPPDYRWQMYLQMDCCEREWWDFFSFDPRLKGDLKRFQVRLPRDDKKIAEMRGEIEDFLGEVVEYAKETTSEPIPEVSLEDKLREAVKNTGKYPETEYPELYIQEHETV